MAATKSASPSLPVKVGLFGLVLLIGSLPIAAMFWRQYADQRRLATEPHVRGSVLSYRRIKQSTRAVIEFVRKDASGNYALCQTEVTLPGHQVEYRQTVFVVPRENSCGQPAVALVEPERR